MWVEVAPGWTLSFDRGPDWLFVRINPPEHGDTHEIPLAESVWERLDQSFTYRVVVEMDEVGVLRSWLIGELVKLHLRIASQDGLLRLSGLCNRSQEILEIMQLADRFPQYRSRTDAVMGNRPLQPR